MLVDVYLIIHFIMIAARCSSYFLLFFAVLLVLAVVHGCSAGMISACATGGVDFSTNQIIFDLPPTAPLATAIDVWVVSEGLKRLSVEQRDISGHTTGPIEVSVLKVDGSLRVQIVPQLLGAVEFTAWGEFKDGSFAQRDFSVVVTQPLSEPLEFRADYNNFHKIILGEIGDTNEFSPIARYAVSGAASSGREVEVQVNDYVTYRHTGASDPSVVRLEEDGTLTALRPGMAEIEARYGSSVDVVSVSVGLNY